MDHGSLGHFDLLQKIGEGGMGVVYKARDNRLERIVALKLLPESRLADPERRARFIREAKAASALNHPNIVTIHEIGEQDGRMFIVMEFVDGRPLNELIPRKGMSTSEALRVATQVAGALTAAHAAGIVHRDLKPGNIMVDSNGRVKVLDFGLAKMAAAPAVGNDETTRTIPTKEPLTEEGALVGSFPYMSPEQAEGRTVDARSDIFSFGSVLYEMVTGQRAFRGRSRISTLAAIVGTDPPPPSSTGAMVPPELERLITRCLRKDIGRRSQNMADVKLALEELREESDSGKLMGPAAGVRARPRWVWPAIASACIVVALIVVSWAYLSRSREPHEAELVRLSPNDGNSYTDATISSDGKFVAYVSDRSGTDELWLQQVGGGDPIQLTHSMGSVEGPQFFPDATRIVYLAHSPDTRETSIQIIHTLGGQPRTITSADIHNLALSPDGGQIAYFEGPGPSPNARLMLIASDGGPPRELSNAHRVGIFLFYAVWTADARSLVLPAPKRPDAPKSGELEWYAVPVDGGDPVRTGVGDVFAAAGLKFPIPTAVTSQRMLFYSAKGEATEGNLWEIRFHPRSWKIAGGPRQLTFLTGSAHTTSAASNGTMPITVETGYVDLHIAPLDPRDGKAAGVTRRLTRDGRVKGLVDLGGDPRNTYFEVLSDRSFSFHSVDLDHGIQTNVTPELSTPLVRLTISHDGRQIAYSIPDGDSYSIGLAETGTGPKDARIVCKMCGLALLFSADGHYLMYWPKAKNTASLRRAHKLTVRLLELPSVKDKPWLEHPTESVVGVHWLGQNASWLWVTVSPVGSADAQAKQFVVPWQQTAVPFSEWIPLKGPQSTCQPSPTSNFLYCWESGKLFSLSFDPNTRSFGPSIEQKFVRGSEMDLGPEDSWVTTGLGLVFGRLETHGSVWLMKLPD